MRKLFDLVGKITVDGIEGLQKNLLAINKSAEAVVKPLARMGNQMSRLGTQMTKNLTVPLAAAGVAIYKGVEAASDLAETVSKVNQIFGDSADDINNWSNATAASIGQSKQQAMDAAATFAIFGKSAGLTGKSLSEFSIKFSELASDLASFHNTSPEEAITAIGAALRGENEPMRRYGVLLDDATMRQKALELGIISTVKNALTPQQKVLAAQALILEQTKDAQGDFARTSGGLANQTRIWKAEVADLTVMFGTSFLPVVLSITKIFREKLLPSVEKLINWWNELPAGVHETVVKFAAFVAIAGPAILLMGQIVSSITMITTVVKTAQVAIAALNTVFIATPVGATAALFVVLAYSVWKAVDAFNDLKKAKENLNKADEITKVNKQIIEYIKLKNVYTDLLNTQLDYQKKGDINFDPEKVQFYKEEIGKVITKVKELNATVNPRAAAEAERKAQAESAQATLEATIAKIAATNAAKDAALAANEKQKESDKILSDKRKEQAEQRIQLEKDWSQKAYESSDSDLDILNRQETDAIESAEKVGADTTSIYEYYSNERQKIFDKERENQRAVGNKTTEEMIVLANKEDAEKERLAKEEQDRRELGKEIAVNTVQGLLSAWAEFSQIRIQNIDNELKTNIAAIETSKMSAEDKEKAILELQTQADKKKRALQRKAAIAEKAGAIFSIVLSTAQAIMKAVGQLGPIAGAVAGVAMGVLGAVQVALIAARPIPLKRGGLAKATDGGIDATIAEGGQDEFVLPMRTGIPLLVDEFMKRLSSIALPDSNYNPAYAGNSSDNYTNNSSSIRDLHVHAGIIIADDFSKKRFAQDLKKYLIMEGQRISVAGV